MISNIKFIASVCLKSSFYTIKNSFTLTHTHTKITQIHTKDIQKANTGAGSQGALILRLGTPDPMSAGPVRGDADGQQVKFGLLSMETSKSILQLKPFCLPASQKVQWFGKKRSFQYCPKISSKSK